jgi:hypothetical protein
LPVVPLVNWMLMGSWQPFAASAPFPTFAKSPKFNMPFEAVAPIRITNCSDGKRLDTSAPAAQCSSSGASACNISRYSDVRKRSALTMARHPEMFSAYSSSLNR